MFPGIRVWLKSHLKFNTNNQIVAANYPVMSNVLNYDYNYYLFLGHAFTAKHDQEHADTLQLVLVNILNKIFSQVTFIQYLFREKKK